MSTAHKLLRIWLASVAVVLFCSIGAAQVQKTEPPKAKPETATPQHAADAVGTYLLRTYEVGDLVINVQDHPYSEALQRSPKPAPGGGGGLGGGGGGIFSVPDDPEMRTQSRRKTKSGVAPIVMLSQFGGGGGRGRADASTDEMGASGAGNVITMNDLARVLVNTAASETWSQNGGDGKIESLGTALIVWQSPEVHQQIEQLLKQIRETSKQRRTLTIDARWLLLTSDELDSLLVKDSSAIDRKALAKFTRRAGSIRGITNCFSGQLVYLVSGTQRNIVTGWIPVVGALENESRSSSLVASHDRPRIRLVAETQSGGFSKGGNVGYQPIVQGLNFGTVLEIRPTLMGGVNVGVIVDLKSTLTAVGEHAPESDRADKPEALAPSVDRVAIETQELATTLRVSPGEPVLVGGMTYLSSSAKANDDSKSSERPQLYMVLEIR